MDFKISPQLNPHIWHYIFLSYSHFCDFGRRTAKAPKRQTAKAPNRQSAKAPKRQSAKPPKRQTAKAPKRQTGRLIDAEVDHLSVHEFLSSNTGKVIPSVQLKASYRGTLPRCTLGVA